MPYRILMLSLYGLTGALAAEPSAAPAQATAPATNATPTAKPSVSSPVHATESNQGLQAKREARFAALMQNVTLAGYWRMTEAGGAQASPRLSDPQPESYRIVSATKLQADQWLITARIQYASHDVNLPVTVRVIWAGETPVITVDEINLPVLGTYSARVMIYHDAYAGIWHGGGHGGIMSGLIRPTPPAHQDAPKAGGGVPAE